MEDTTNMPTKFKLIRSVEYLQTDANEDIDLEASKQMLIEIAKAKRPLADFDLLLDFRRIQLKLNTVEIYFLASELHLHGDTFCDKVAILVLPGLNFEKAEFFELCAKNRGFKVDCFTNYEDAVQWFYED